MNSPGTPESRTAAGLLAKLRDGSLPLTLLDKVRASYGFYQEACRLREFIGRDDSIEHEDRCWAALEEFREDEAMGPRALPFNRRKAAAWLNSIGRRDEILEYVPLEIARMRFDPFLAPPALTDLELRVLRHGVPYPAVPNTAVVIIHAEEAEKVRGSALSSSFLDFKRPGAALSRDELRALLDGRRPNPYADELGA
jgi:hypothetical protein